jgi:two-component system, cell cycle response regulator
MSLRRVLVIDDDRLILEVLETVLDLEEFDVVTADDGETGLDRLREHRPDVVVCDVMMPGIDGLEVCRRIKADPETVDLPVVLLTARDRPEDRAAGEAAGCDAYVIKPFSPLHLIDVIGDVQVPGRQVEGSAAEKGS